MAQRNWSFKGRGEVYMEDIEAGGGLMSIGNASQLDIAAEVNQQTQQDFTQPSGGLANSISSLSNVTLSITHLDVSPGNLARALRGTIDQITGGTTVTDERHTANAGALIPFDNTPDITDTSTITVTLQPDGTATSLSEGTDYEVTRAGIRILDGWSGSDGDEIGVDYTQTEASVVQALVEAGKEFRLVFDGLNEAQSGKAVTVVVHRAKFSPTSGLSLIGDDFGELPVEGEILSDNSVAAGDSPFFRVHMEE